MANFCGEGTPDRERSPPIHDSELFRAVAAAVFALDFGIAGYHRRRARSREGRPGRGDEPLSLRAARVLVAGPLFLGLGVYLVHPAWMAWAAVDLPVSLRWLGAGLMAATVPLTWWLMRHLGGNVTETALVAEGSRLVTTGPYRRVRHPLYTTSLLLWTGVSLSSANLFFGAFTVLFAGVLLGLVVPREEAALVERFGEEYRRYRERAGRLLPRVGP